MRGNLVNRCGPGACPLFPRASLVSTSFGKASAGRTAEENGDWLTAHSAYLITGTVQRGPGACPLFPWASLVRTSFAKATAEPTAKENGDWLTAHTSCAATWSTDAGRVPVPFFRGQAWSAPLSARPAQNRRRRKTGTGSRPPVHARQLGQPMRAGCLSPFSVGKPGQHLFRQGQRRTEGEGKRGLAHGPHVMRGNLVNRCGPGACPPFPWASLVRGALATDGVTILNHGKRGIARIRDITG
jgi:hypothetical protein